MAAGRGLCVIDPHGDLYKELLGKVPRERISDVVLLDPTQIDWPVGINPLQYEIVSQKHFIIQEFCGIISRLIEDEYGLKAVGEFAGPIFFQHMRMNLLLAMSRPSDPATLLQFYTMFQERDFWKRWCPLQDDDPQLRCWVEQVLPSTNYLRPGSDSASLGGWIASKFHHFVFDPMLRNIFGQLHSRIDLRRIMDEGKILLVNLARGELTDANSRFFGMLLIAKLQAAAMARVNVEASQRRPFYLFVDEFHNLATQNFVTLLSEARKFGLSLVLANQFVSQINDRRIVDAIFGNIGSIICFRIGMPDAELLERHLTPSISRTDLTNVPNWHAYASSLANGEVVPAFLMRNAPPDATYDERTAHCVIQASRHKYSRPRSEVEREVLRSLQMPSIHETEESIEEMR
jgi:hypothetical protein